jgi:hypothetical protein
VLTIRNEQLHALEENLFKRWITDHLTRHFPAQCERIGSQGLLGLIDFGMARARDYHFSARSDVSRYLDIAMVFGRTFDQDLDWAKEILEDPRIMPGSVRMDLLYDAATERESSASLCR